MNLWTKHPIFYIPLEKESYLSGKDLYDQQISHLANALIINDYDPNIEVKSVKISAASALLFPKDSLVSGSFVTNLVAKQIAGVNIPYDDIDIYFKSKEDAQLFLTMNNTDPRFFSDFSNPMCSYGFINGDKFNLIYGVGYSSPENLISRFDIRACSMAIDINTSTLYAVKHSVMDATKLKIVFNPVPRSVTIRRLTKYIDKEFKIDPYQSVFFVELLRSHLYSAELELMTKNY